MVGVTLNTSNASRFEGEIWFAWKGVLMTRCIWQVLGLLACFFMLYGTALGQIPIPVRVGGTVSIDGVQLTEDNDAGYTFSVKRPDGSPYDPPARDDDGLNAYHFYKIDIPVYSAEHQTGGAIPGSEAVIHVVKDGTALTVTQPPQGRMTVGDAGSMIQIDISATTQSQPYTLSVTTSGNGTVTSNPAGIDCGGDCSEAYVGGTEVTLTATPDARWAFTGWRGACSGLGDCQITVESNQSVSANFIQTEALSDFDDGMAGGWIDDGSGRWSVSGGVYAMGGNKEGVARFSYDDETFCDGTFQADVRKISGDIADRDGRSYSYSYGLRFRAAGTSDNYYFFYISERGGYIIGKNVNGDSTIFEGWADAAVLNTGFGEWNTLKVVAEESILAFYANDNFLSSFEDSSFSCGKIGVYAYDGSDSDNPDTVEFDNVRITVNPPPFADFSASPLKGTAPLLVGFTDSSANVPGNWVWDFGDGHVSTRQNPFHVYENSGLYSVSLIVSNAKGSDQVIKTEYIEVLSCANGSIRIGPKFYTSIQDAYSQASDGDVIQCQALTFSEDLVFDRDISVTIQGGHDCGYAANEADTRVKSMVIRNGKIIAEKLILNRTGP